MQIIKYKIANTLSCFKLLSISSLLLLSNLVHAAVSDTAYTRVVHERAEKIVGKIDIKKETTKVKVVNIVAIQYETLNNIYKERDSLKAVLKVNMDSATTIKTDQAHKKFIAQLSKYLSADQVIAVKDGLTYGVVPLTYNAYLDMLPQLTDEQKKQIYAWLVEAREHAMDAESSEKKHAWFGKYKGRVNNYLSAAGIDMRVEGEKWQKRIAEKNKNKNN